MKIVSIQLAQSVRLLDISDFLAKVYLPDASKALVEKYGFMRTPTFDELNSPTGGVFVHGKFMVGSRAVRIDLFHIYSNALMASTKTSTDDADAFLDEVVVFASEHLGASADLATPSGTTHLSKLEVELDIPLERTFPFLDPIGKRISEMVRSFASDLAPTFQLTGLNFFFDTSKLAMTPFQPFSLERRVQKPFDSNLYFAQAPLKTSEHVSVLEELERILRANQR